MKNHFYIALHYAVMLMMALACTSNQNLDDINRRLDALEKNQVPSADQQISSIRQSLNSLDGVVKELKKYQDELKDSDLGNYAALAEDLKKKDGELQSAIDELKEYVKIQDNATQDWTTATFTTIAQHNAVITLISEVKVDISQLEQKLNLKIESDIADAVKNAESDIKSWVNTLLSGYWTIAESEAKLNALKITLEAELDAQKKELMDQITGGVAEDFDSLKKKVDDLEKIAEKNKEDIKTLSEELETAKTTLTSEYTDAINLAISTLDGKITTEIADALESANANIKALESRINESISKLETRVTNLEGTLEEVLGMIQSIAVIPTYSDGSVGIMGEDPTIINFEIRPLSAAEKLNDIPLDAISLSAVYTQTKANVEFVPLTIQSITYDNGIVSLSVVGDKLSYDFFSTVTGANARLYIESGKNSVSTSYFKLTPVGPHRKVVDMGLSVKWGACNLGAVSPMESGGYYVWGATEPGVEVEYSLIQNLKSLPADMDAATVNLGGSWRIPTKDEVWELIENTQSSDLLERGGLKCFEITSNINGNKLLIPAAGYKTNAGLTEFGESSSFWSSTVKGVYGTSVLSIYYYSCPKRATYLENLYRSSYYALPIRPVCD